MVMANFKFKIISKIIADRLASILPTIVSEEQKGFIHERNIKDCLCVASEAVNLLHNKSFGGVRQGDPLSPLLFCLAEDVLSRSISKLVAEGKLDLIKGTRNYRVPSHSFYVDDLMIFCKGKLSGLKALKDLFNLYALESGQVINNSKSTIFCSSITQGRLALIVQLLNFNIAWKTPLLSVAGRVQLVRFVVQSMLICSISIYSWPVALLKDIEKSVRNFIRSGDIDKRKLVTTSWRKICRPFSQGGLNYRSLSKLNKGTNLKLCWNFINSHCSWAKLVKDRVIRGPVLGQGHLDP
ncbi:hypothetical protein TSUD_55940 [Trifolium subterraneum]|uniref:Reverse transcriptase domain-containing protein n=1 Tax=Trifolium subterraneum TaxID=3900 RepID=A0A2Z6M370_TRISU|nr:hypothetical protein TSUD_55940 [Trifolium subterraneum]